MPSDTRELIDACLAGEESSWRDLIDRFKGQVYGLCYRMTSHKQDAEDMAQETFVRALRSLNTYDVEREFEPWLLAIAGNRCRTLLARRSSRPTSISLIEATPSEEPGLQAAEQLAEEVELGLANLREEYRMAFRLFHEQELSYQEIGEILDCPIGTVKTWVHRARRELVVFLSQRGVIEERRDVVRRA